jgi:predicted Zn-dependent peptidase
MKAKKTVLKNGLRVVTVPMKGNPTVTVLVVVEAGTKYETPDNNGLSHFLEHMCFKGTNNRSTRDIAYAIETLGADTNAFTSYDYTGYYIKGKVRDVNEFLDIVSDVYLNSTFPVDEIQKERGVICGEIDMVEDTPQRAIYYSFLESLYGKQPAGMTILGPKSNIHKFTRDDFVLYHKKHYTAGATAVVISGDVDHTNMVKQVTKLFSGIPHKPAVKKPALKKIAGVKKITKTKKTDQSHIIVGTRLPAADHADIPALTIASCILGNGMGSRLFIKLREEMGAGYYVYSSIATSDDGSHFVIATGTEPKRVPEILNAINGEIKKLYQNQIPQSDIKRAKEYLIGRLYMGLESTDDVATQIGLDEILHQKLKTPQEIEKELRAVTISDVVRVTKKYLKFETFHQALVGPHK